MFYIHQRMQKKSSFGIVYFLTGLSIKHITLAVIVPVIGQYGGNSLLLKIILFPLNGKSTRYTVGWFDSNYFD